MGCKDDYIILYFECYHNIYTGILNFTFLMLRQFYHHLYSTIHFYMPFSIQAHQNLQKTFPLAHYKKIRHLPTLQKL